MVHAVQLVGCLHHCHVMFSSCHVSLQCSITSGESKTGSVSVKHDAAYDVENELENCKYDIENKKYLSGIFVWCALEVLSRLVR